MISHKRPHNRPNAVVSRKLRKKITDNDEFLYCHQPVVLHKKTLDNDFYQLKKSIRDILRIFAVRRRSSGVALRRSFSSCLLRTRSAGTCRRLTSAMRWMSRMASLVRPCAMSQRADSEMMLKWSWRCHDWETLWKFPCYWPFVKGIHRSPNLKGTLQILPETHYTDRHVLCNVEFLRILTFNSSLSLDKSGVARS